MTQILLTLNQQKSYNLIYRNISWRFKDVSSQELRMGMVESDDDSASCQLGLQI